MQQPITNSCYDQRILFHWYERPRFCSAQLIYIKRMQTYVSSLCGRFSRPTHKHQTKHTTPPRIINTVCDSDSLGEEIMTLLRVYRPHANTKTICLSAKWNDGTESNTQKKNTCKTCIRCIHWTRFLSLCVRLLIHSSSSFSGDTFDTLYIFIFWHQFTALLPGNKHCSLQWLFFRTKKKDLATKFWDWNSNLITNLFKWGKRILLQNEKKWCGYGNYVTMTLVNIKISRFRSKHN